MFSIVSENVSLLTQISAIMISHTFDFSSFLYAICFGLPITGGLVSTKNLRILHPMVSKGLNVPQNVGFYDLTFFSAISVIDFSMLLPSSHDANPGLVLYVFMKMKAPMPVQYESAVECCRLANLSVYTCVKATTTSLFRF
ncbi:hypothetical protein AMTRI_Chr02g218440 [Amborella trichopoda]